VQICLKENNTKRVAVSPLGYVLRTSWRILPSLRCSALMEGSADEPVC